MIIMQHPLLWTFAAYALLHAIAIGLLRYNFHKDGCHTCNTYGGDCPCGYEPITIPEILEDRHVAIACVVILMLIELPFLLGLVFAIEHAIMPFHQRRCLAAVLEGNEED